MSIIHTVTEGGQIWTHRVRMLKQVIKIAVFFSLIIWFLIFSFKMSQHPLILYKGFCYNLEAKFLLNFPNNEYLAVTRETWKEISKENVFSDPVLIPKEKVVRITESYYVYLSKIAYANMINTSWNTLWFFGAMIFYFFIRGNLSKRKQHIAGKKIYPAWLITLLLKLKGKASSIRIGSLPLVKGTETQHIMVTGGTGSGKTNCFNHILPQIRNQRQRAVVIDTSGGFVNRYYRPGKDFILNPIDPRGAPWHPWVECQDKFDYEAIAESFIPQSYSEHDNYWRIAARSLLSSILHKVGISKNTSELTRWMLFEPLTKLSEFVKGTKAAAHIDMNSEKTAGSIRSVCSSFLVCLEYMQDTQNPFSIRDWIEKGNPDSWLFLTCNPMQRSALNPLISCWFSIALRSLLQLKPDLERRIWFIVDELPTLNRLKDLESFLSESRKYGGCALLALQSPAQLEAIYGQEIAKTILGNCATKIIFSEQEPEIAERISKIFGEREIKEYQEGLSYGANDVRDGVNLSLQSKNLPLVPSTSIQFLDKNEAYIKLAGNFPIAKIKLSIAK